MLLEQKQRYGNFLEKLADTLDLTENQHKKSEGKVYRCW